MGEEARKQAQRAYILRMCDLYMSNSIYLALLSIYLLDTTQHLLDTTQHLRDTTHHSYLQAGRTCFSFCRLVFSAKRPRAQLGYGSLELLQWTL